MHEPIARIRGFATAGSDRCEYYCLIHESVSFAPHWIDHIVAEKHGGKTEAGNLANSCILCNQKKGQRFEFN